MVTLGHTSVSRFAVRSLMSLCLIDGRAPLGQLRACFSYNHKHNVMASLMIPTHSGDTVSPERILYGG